MITFAGDLETTVYDGQTETHAWSSALCDIDSGETFWFNSLASTLEFFKSLKQDVIVYYHNLKFDGKFWLDYLMDVKLFRTGLEYDGDEIIGMKNRKDLKNDEIIYSISAMGQWYTITFKYRDKLITLKDSYKLLPFKLSKVLSDFKTKHQKLEMDYEGDKPLNYVPTDQEKAYILNDVVGLKEALEIMFSEGHDALTIGSCCLKEYRKMTGMYSFGELFPPLHEMTLCRFITQDGKFIPRRSIKDLGFDNVDSYIRESYRGGWCYRVGNADYIECNNGITLDVNSLYPSMMHSDSGNYYPIGTPTFWQGNFIPRQAYRSTTTNYASCLAKYGKEYAEKNCVNNRYFFVRFKCRFELKSGFLPFVQIKRNILYKANDMLTTSDYYDKKSGKYYRYYVDRDGNKHDTSVTLTMTCSDFELFKKHYNVYDFEILDGCYFTAMKGIFDEYINHYAEIKMNSKGAQRTIAKLFLNNLYGKLATSKDSSFKIAEIENGVLKFKNVYQENKKPVYIPCGSAITSYSRCFTINAAQANYYGSDKHGFKYADTDSIHCDLPLDKIKGVKLDDVKFNHWKPESFWDYARFVRQKTYVEHVTHANMKPIEHPYYNVKCAGMPELSKNIFLYSFGVDSDGHRQYDESGHEITLSDKELIKYEHFVNTKRTIDDFKQDLSIAGKLLPMNIKGGVVLTDSIFTMKSVRLV